MKKIISIIITIILICVSFSGCTSSNQDIIIDDSLFQNAPRDPFTFNDIKIIQNLLHLNVSYGGGCEEHIFKLISTSFMESNPVQVNIVLSHEDNDDPCDMWVTENYIFNILPLKKSWQQSYQQNSGIIIMNIEGWNQPINYEF
jgi:hypothetical protein